MNRYVAAFLLTALLVTGGCLDAERGPTPTMPVLDSEVSGDNGSDGHGSNGETDDRSTVGEKRAALARLATDSTTIELFNRVMDTAAAQHLERESISNVMQRVGLLFVGSDYVGGLLDADPTEQLVVSLDKFDCVLFVETVLALSQGIVEENRSFDDFVVRLERMRYRDGVLDGYCSRLHYFSEWIADNESKGIVHNVTLALGGLRAEGKLDFMSRNRDLYARFARNDSLFAGIQKMEDSIATMDRWYIPQSRIRSVYPSLKSGDIIATSTTVEGLDVSHSGLVYRDASGGVGFLHASTNKGVTVADDLADYVNANNATFGIVVARPVDPRLSYE